MDKCLIVSVIYTLHAVVFKKWISTYEMEFQMKLLVEKNNLMLHSAHFISGTKYMVVSKTSGALIGVNPSMTKHWSMFFQWMSDENDSRVDPSLKYDAI